MKQDVLLQMTDICKEFPGVKALDHVSLTVKAGTVHALMGENGAGKSTLMKCLFGIYDKDSGKIELEGKEINFKNSKEALENGVAMVHQELNQALKRNVMDNLWLGRYPKVGGVMVNEKKIYDDTKKVFEELKIDVDPKRIMSTMPVSQRQMVEIAKAVSVNAKVIVFDEPTSSLTEQEVEHLFDIIEMLKKRGCGIIYISHKMEEVFRIADDITVLRDGAVVSTDRAKDLNLDTVIARMVGRKLDNVYPKEEVKIGATALEVKNFSRKDLFEDINFHVSKGEIVGFAGLVGAGRTETMRAVFGLDPHDSGQVLINDREAKIKCPHDSIRQKMVMLSESRRDDGIIPVRSVMENASLASLERIIYKGYTHKAEEKKSVKESFDKMHVKTPTLDTAISTLSGGNQQKVLLARWLLCEPDIMILDEPTRGIDVGAKFEIYKLITDIVKEGKAVIMVSSELPELIGMCDRIYIMCQGKISGCINRNEFSQETIMKFATGLKNN